MSGIFERYAPFIQDFIYKNNWTELRPVQTEAARVIFDTENKARGAFESYDGKIQGGGVAKTVI